MATTASATASAAVLGEQGDFTLAASSIDDKVISVPPEDRLSPAIDENPGPLAAELLEFCEMDLFPETLHNSEVTSSSNCYQDNFSYAANLSFPSDVNTNYSSDPIVSNSFQNHPNATIIDSNNTLSIIFDSQDELGNTVSSSIDFSTSPPYSGPPYLTITDQDQLDFSSLDPENQLSDIAVNSLSQYPSNHPVISFMPPALSSAYEEDCLSMMPPFLRFNPSASSSYNLLDPPMDSMPGTLNSSLVGYNSGIFTKNILVGSEPQSKEAEYFDDPSGKFCPQQLQHVFNSSDIQSLSNDKQLVNGAGAVSAPMSTEISTLEESSFKPGKLSAEERREKIHRYLKKRNERNFNKKIKYACRKTLADSRPRVRGRFAKNDEFAGCQNEEYDFDEVLVPVKVEDDMANSSDIFAHINGVSSFKCGFPIKSWI